MTFEEDYGVESTNHEPFPNPNSDSVTLKRHVYMKIHINYWCVAYVKIVFNLYKINLFEVSLYLYENNKRTFKIIFGRWMTKCFENWLTFPPLPFISPDQTSAFSVALKRNEKKSN